MDRNISEVGSGLVASWISDSDSKGTVFDLDGPLREVRFWYARRCD